MTQPARRRTARAVGACLATACAIAASGPRIGAQSDPNGAGAGAVYRLVDTWRDRPWTLTAGRFGAAGDISSAPDGTAFILDTRTAVGRPAALHVIAPDGHPVRVMPVLDPPEWGKWTPLRLDAAPDGTLYLLEWLSAGRSVDGRTIYTIYRVRHIDGDAHTLDAFEMTLAPNTVVTDVAVGPDGLLYVTYVGKALACQHAGAPPPDNVPGQPPFFSIDVYTPDGRRVEQIAPPELLLPIAVDVGSDGRIWAISHGVPACPPPLGAGTPTATEQPSLAVATPAATGDRIAEERIDAERPDQQPTPSAPPASRAVDGVLLFGADHALAATVAHSGDEDIAVGPSGAFVAQGVDIFRVHEAAAGPVQSGFVEPAPLWTGPADQVSGTFADQTSLFLDVPGDGRLLASFNHCLFRGLMTFADPAARPAIPALTGGTDAPELEGPRYPVRVAAADSVAVLLGRFAFGGSRVLDGAQAYVTNGSTEAQTVQRWAADGRLRSQLGLCPDGGLLLGAAAATVRDIALDGDTVYTIDSTVLQARPDDALPAFTFWPGEAIADDPSRGSLLTAVAADDGRAAVLDVGAGMVTVLDSGGQRLAAWPLGGAGRIARPVDLAIHGDRVAVADVATGRVFVMDLSGRPIADWPLHDGPRAIAAAPDGGWVVLGRGGWGHHYAADGRLIARWSMPDRTVEPRDIAVDRAGRVYVNFVQIGDKRERGWIATAPVQRAGVWVFERAAAPPEPTPPIGGCYVGRDKTAAPGRIPLGDTVDVTLTVTGRCPDHAAPVDVLVLFDTSRSMTDLAVFDSAQSAVLAFLDALDPTTARAGLIGFADGSTLAAPLSADIGAVAARVAALRPGGDTRLTGALDAALLAFRDSPPPLPGTQRAVVIVTDAVLKDDVLPEPAAAALAADGVSVHALIFPSLDFSPAARDAIVKLAAPPGRSPAGTVLVAPELPEVERLARSIAQAVAPTAALESLTVVDRVPANMRYVPDSARPVARYDAAAHALTWPGLVVDAADPITLTYRLQPRQTGVWPTNVEATGDYHDALGHDGRIVFPIPEVEVYAGRNTIYLPIAVRDGCLVARRPLDLALVVDASSSMREPSASGRGTKMDAARDAATALAARLDGATDRAAIIRFHHDAATLAPLTADRARLTAALAAITTDEGTRIDLGLDEARDALAGRRADAVAVVVLLTDGLQANPPGNAAVIAAAQRLAADADALIYTIGLGADIDAPLLRTVAGDADRFFPSPDDTELTAIFTAILDRLPCDQAAAP
ncbi:MAG: VWA domain-containing protein [Ardenticatenales bacterium]